MHRSDIQALVRAAIAVAWVVGVSACGGGGGGSPDPVMGTLSFTTNENVALTGTLTATDPGGTAVTFTKTSDPKSGTLTVASNGSFTYTPGPNFTGSDSFGVQATDSAGNMSAGTVGITVTVDRPPVASNTIIRADGASLASINVLANASDPDKDPLTVTILEQPPPGLGTASVNSDGTISLAGLASFKGLTHFTYQVTDPSGMTAKASAAIFVGTDPFRASFVGDAPANGSNEVYLTDFAADPVVMTAATQGTLRLQGYAISDSGSTVVYRVQDTTSAATTSLSFVKTSAPAQATAIQLPSGTVPVQDANNNDQYIVSPDGNWIAVIAGQGSSDSLYVVNVANPTVVSQVEPSGAAYATRPTFSLDSKSIYFLATTVAGGAHKSLYFASLSMPAQTTLISAASDPATSDEIYAYSVSPDQTRILLDANRSGRRGIYFVDAAHPATENQVSRAMAFGQSIQGSTVGLPAGQGGSTTVARVAYTVNAGTADPINNPAGVFVAEVSTSPNPRLVVTNVSVIGLRPDDSAILYTDGAQVSEAVIDVTGTTAVGGGYGGWYDSTGNIVLLQQHVPYTVLASTSRGDFGATQRVGTTSLANIYNDVSGFDDGVTVIAQGPTSGAPPAMATLQIVSALAPQVLMPLASFQSPMQLTSYASKIVAAAQ